MEQQLEMDNEEKIEESEELYWNGEVLTGEQILLLLNSDNILNLIDMDIQVNLTGEELDNFEDQRVYLEYLYGIEQTYKAENKGSKEPPLTRIYQHF